MNDIQFLIFLSILSFILGGLTDTASRLFVNLFKKKFKLENLKDIINTQNKAIKIIKDSNEIMETQSNKLNEILEVLENAKH